MKTLRLKGSLGLDTEKGEKHEGTAPARCGAPLLGSGRRLFALISAQIPCWLRGWTAAPTKPVCGDAGLVRTLS